MKASEVLGLDDLGRTLRVVRTADPRGDFACEIVFATDWDGVVEIVDNVVLTDEMSVARVRQAESHAAWYDEIASYIVPPLKTSKGSMKTPTILFGSFDSISLSAASEIGKSKQKKNSLKSRSNNVSHPKRKPQPNRGPVGKKDWK